MPLGFDTLQVCEQAPEQVERLLEAIGENRQISESKSKQAGEISACFDFI